MDGDNFRRAVAVNGCGVEGGDGRREVLPWSDLRQITETIEETAYEGVFTPEIGARESFSTLTSMAGITTRIGLATGVVPLGSRDPRLVAMEAATLDDLSGGRFLLGIGSREPIEAVRGRIGEIRSFLRGGSPGPDAAPLDLLAPRVPLFLGALGPRMTELAGEAADGVLLNWCTPERVARAREQLERGTTRAGRDPESVTVAVYVRCCLGQDEERALRALAGQTGRYAAIPHYLRQFEAMGFGEEARVAAKGWEAGRAEDVPEDLVRTVCVMGGRDESLRRLRAYREAGADLVVVYPVPVVDALSSILGTILAAAPSPAVER